MSGRETPGMPPMSDYSTFYSLNLVIIHPPAEIYGLCVRGAIQTPFKLRHDDYPKVYSLDEFWKGYREDVIY